MSMSMYASSADYWQAQAEAWQAEAEKDLAEIGRLRAALEVLQAATNAAVSKARFQASTNAELNALHDQVRKLKALACAKFNDEQDASAAIDAAVAAERKRRDEAFTAAVIEAIYAAWHGAGVDIAGGNWTRFVGMLPRA